MAIPIAPSGLTLIVEGMKRALGRTPSSGEQARALDHWFPEIKNDIWFDDGGSHALLETDALMLLTEGTHIYSLPSDFDSGVPPIEAVAYRRASMPPSVCTLPWVAASDSSESA